MYSDFYYYENNKYKYNEGEQLSNLPHLSKATPPKPSFFNGWGALNASLISNAYYFSADSEMYIHLYFPIPLEFKNELLGYIWALNFSADKANSIKRNS